MRHNNDFGGFFLRRLFRSCPNLNSVRISGFWLQNCVDLMKLFSTPDVHRITNLEVLRDIVDFDAGWKTANSFALSFSDMIVAILKYNHQICRLRVVEENNESLLKYLILIDRKIDVEFVPRESIEYE